MKLKKTIMSPHQNLHRQAIATKQSELGEDMLPQEVITLLTL